MNIFLCRIPFLELCFKWFWWYSSNRFRWFQGIFKYMEGPGYYPVCDTSTLTISNNVWTFLLCVLSWIRLFYPSLHVFPFLSYDCIFSHCTAYILAFWLKLFVYNATLNTSLSYLISSHYFTLFYLTIIISFPSNNDDTATDFILQSCLTPFANCLFLPCLLYHHLPTSQYWNTQIQFW